MAIITETLKGEMKPKNKLVKIFYITIKHFVK